MLSSSSAFPDSKRHFQILDALRGIAAIIVVLYHLLEIYSNGDRTQQIINHGYLAVDFFFMLSGYVMAHAYDDRWDTMTTKEFFKRRIIRLHPLVIVGTLLGALLFYTQESAMFPLIANTSIWNVIIVTIIGMTLIPITISMDIRGWDEMHPLNGAAWSLFFEYIANILHVFILRKLSKLVLAILVLLAAIALMHMALTTERGDITGGWALNVEQMKIGFTRLLFPYLAGMLLRRMVDPIKKKNTFLLAAIILIATLSVPRIGSANEIWQNGLYDALIVIFVFPMIIYWGAIGEVTNQTLNKACTFLGDISYPLYILHFPFVLTYLAWVANNKIPMSQGIWVGLGVLIFSLIFSYAVLKWYDIPVRKWLMTQLNKKKVQ